MSCFRVPPATNEYISLMAKDPGALKPASTKEKSAVFALSFSPTVQLVDAVALFPD